MQLFTYKSTSSSMLQSTSKSNFGAKNPSLHNRIPFPNSIQETWYDIDKIVHFLHHVTSILVQRQLKLTLKNKQEKDRHQYISGDCQVWSRRIKFRKTNRSEVGVVSQYGLQYFQ